ncbi:MAG TPA: ATP-binding protein [Chryseosolibacter sp.]|nr:ATP-binding protein [Chryseosolibacter sp.]
MNRTLLSVLIVLLVLCQVFCAAQVFHVSSHSKKSKPFAYTLNAIHEDRFGYVWLATDRGLLRYDGRSARKMVSGNFTGIFEVEGGAVATAGDRLISLRDHSPPDTVAFALTNVPVRIRSISHLVDTGNGILLMLTDAGPFMLKDRRLIKANAVEGDVPNSDGVLLTHEQEIRLLTSAGLSYTWDTAREQFSGPRNLGGKLSRLKHAMSTGESILVLDGTTLRQIVNDTLVDLDVSGLPVGVEFTSLTFFDGDPLVATEAAGLWLGHKRDGKYSFRKILNGNEPHRTAELPFPGATAVFCAANKNIWAGTGSDLWLLKPRPFKRITHDIPMVTFEQAVFGEGSNVYLDAESVLYEVEETGNNEYGGKVADIGLPQTQSAVAYHEGRLWIATVDSRIFYYENRRLNQAADLSARGGTIFNLYVDRRGDLWVQQAPSHTPITGTLKITRNLDVIAYGEEAGFKSRMLSAKESTDGTLYFSGIGEHSFLYALDPVNMNFINLSGRMDFDYGDNFEVHEVGIAEDSTFWLASTAGLLRQRNGRTEKIWFDELEENEAVGVLVADDGAVWFGTDSRGVVRYDQGRYRIYDQRAGLATNFISYRSLRQKPGGIIWVGTREGMFISSPEALAQSETNKPIVASVRDAAGREFTGNSFSYNSTIAFDPICLSYPAETVQFAYRLSGYNSDRWIALRKDEKVTLSNLPNGTYTLEIRARQAGGFDWSEPARYDFHVKAAWYRQPLAYLLYAIAAGLLTVGMVRLYNRRLIREKEVLEMKVIERTREIAAKNEEITVQNEEITSQMDEISMQMGKLKTMNDLLAEQRDQLLRQQETIQHQNKQLEEAKSDLEQKVDERTHQLSVANQELIDHNIQLQQFAFMTAHNLRSPVARLLGLTSIFNQENLSDPFNLEVVRRIEKCAEDLDEIIRDISLILQIKKSVTETFETVSIQRVLTKVLEAFKDEIAAKQIKVISQVDPNARVHGIEPYVHSVFYNVISNSIKYADRRKDPEIRIQSRTSRNELQVIVFDNGIGFDCEKQRDKLFKPFSRLNSVAEGKGLGLYMMKIEMDAMHAGIEIQSKLDEGTTVILTFPVPDK